MLIAACALFGFSVGNLITLPSLIVQREFDPRSFGVLVSLITAINQVTYAFGPGVIGLLRDISGSYALPFYGCIGLELIAAALIMMRAKDTPMRLTRTPHAIRLPLPQQILEIQPLREHRQRAVRRARPLLLRPVPVQLDAVLVGIAQIKRLADAVVAGAVELDARRDHAMQRVGQCRPRRIEDRGVEQARSCPAAADGRLCSPRC